MAFTSRQSGAGLTQCEIAEAYILNSFELLGAKNVENGVYFFENSACMLSAEFERGSFLGAAVTPEKYLCMDVTNLTDSTCTVTWRFWESEEGKSDCAMRTAILPQLKTRLALPFSVVDGKILFMPRTPGKLKTVVEGRPIHVDEIRRFAINTAGKPGGVTLKIDALFISDEEPDYPLETVAMVDEMGQKNLTDWEGKTESVEALCENLRREAEDKTERPLPDRSQYGGWTKKRFEATGFFAVENDGRRFWLKDPDGYAFFSTGFDDMAMNSIGFWLGCILCFVSDKFTCKITNNKFKSTLNTPATATKIRGRLESPTARNMALPKL